MNRPHRPAEVATGAPAHAALTARNLRVALGGTEVLHGIDLALARGRWTSIVGPNGAGKSTLLKALAGLLPHAGAIALLERPLAGHTGRGRARRLSWLGQNQSSADDLTVLDVAMLGRLPHQPWLATASAADHAAVEEALRATQAWEWRHRPLGELSGGERQRVLLARALAVQAEVLLMDEPLANLDPPHQADWIAIVQALVAQGRTVVSVLHELSVALHAQDLVVMDQGRVVHHGACAHAATHQAVVKVFEDRVRIHAIDGGWVAVPHLQTLTPRPAT
jgi:iron complex transport system ATP-binding protein